MVAPRQLIAVAVIVVCGLFPSFADEKKPPPSKAQALTIAKRAVVQNDTWSNYAQFEEPTWNKTDQTWEVYVRRLPETPRGHRFVVIDKAGKVIAYVRGM